MRLLRLPHDSARKQREEGVWRASHARVDPEQLLFGGKKAGWCYFILLVSIDRFQKRCGCNIISETCVLENR